MSDEPKKRGRPVLAPRDQTVRVQVRVPRWLADLLAEGGGMSRKAREVLTAWGNGQ